MNCQAFALHLYTVGYNQIMEFSEWLTQKYIDWRGDAIGKDRTISEFAQMVGVSQPTMSYWMKKGGKIPRAKSSIQKLVDTFGYEVYDILGLPKPEAEKIPWDHLPESFRSRLEAATAEVNERFQEEGITPDSDPDGEAALRITTEVFDKYGIDINVNEVDDEG
jgi:transcriptional regulator with XRE-family HTH domain